MRQPRPPKGARSGPRQPDPFIVYATDGVSHLTEEQKTWPVVDMVGRKSNQPPQTGLAEPIYVYPGEDPDEVVKRVLAERAAAGQSSYGGSTS